MKRSIYADIQRDKEQINRQMQTHRDRRKNYEHTDAKHTHLDEQTVALLNRQWQNYYRNKHYAEVLANLKQLHEQTETSSLFSQL